MHGLIRVRQFTISEGHLMCTPEQLEDEFRSCLELAIYMLKTLGLYEDVSYRFSQWDPADTEKYIGTPEQWNKTQDMMAKILDHLEIRTCIGILLIQRVKRHERVIDRMILYFQKQILGILQLFE